MTAFEDYENEKDEDRDFLVPLTGLIRWLWSFFVSRN